MDLSDNPDTEDTGSDHNNDYSLNSSWLEVWLSQPLRQMGNYKSNNNNNNNNNNNK